MFNFKHIQYYCPSVYWVCFTSTINVIQTNFLDNSQECVATWSSFSVGMDGPNVNFKLLDLLQKEHAELHGGAQILMVGSCGLHTLHNAMKAGFTAWQIDKLLRALHFLFHNVPAQREDYINITGSLLLSPLFLRPQMGGKCAGCRESPGSLAHDSDICQGCWE